MVYFFQTRLKQKTEGIQIIPKLVYIAKVVFSFRQVNTPKRVPPSAGMAHFFQTCPKQKPLRLGVQITPIYIPSPNHFLIQSC